MRMFRTRIGKARSLARHAVTRDFIAMTVMQGMGYLIPLLTLPYIVRVVGIEGYGKITFALAVVAYFVILTDYGFTLTATRDIAMAAENRVERARIFSAVLTIKALLLLASCALLVGVLLLVPALRAEATLFLAAFGIVLGNVLMPVWFFQGIQRMGYITVIQFLGQCIYLALLLLLVRGPEDYVFVAASQSVGLCSAGILGLVAVRYRFGFSFAFPAMRDIRAHFANGVDVFFSRVFLNIYTTSNIVILGLLATPVVVGQYAVADKILSVFMVVPNAANQALYPHLARAFSEKGANGLRETLVRPALAMVLGGSALFVAAIVFREPIIQLVTGGLDPQIKFLLSILAVGLVASPLGAFYTNALVTIGETRLMRNILFLTGVVSVILAVPTIMLYGASGLAGVTVIVGLGGIALVRHAYLSNSSNSARLA